MDHDIVFDWLLGWLDDYQAAVWDYMTKANRPYSVINVFDNLHKKVPKREKTL